MSRIALLTMNSNDQAIFCAVFFEGLRKSRLRQRASERGKIHLITRNSLIEHRLTCDFESPAAALHTREKKPA